MKVKVLGTQSCQTLWLLGPPGSSVLGILQARVLEWVAISFSRGSSQPRDQTQVSHIAGRRFNLCTTREAITKKEQRINTDLCIWVWMSVSSQAWMDLSNQIVLQSNFFSLKIFFFLDKEIHSLILPAIKDSRLKFGPYSIEKRQSWTWFSFCLWMYRMIFTWYLPIN